MNKRSLGENLCSKVSEKFLGVGNKKPCKCNYFTVHENQDRSWLSGQSELDDLA